MSSKSRESPATFEQGLLKLAHDWLDVMELRMWALPWPHFYLEVPADLGLCFSVNKLIQDTLGSCVQGEV